MKSVFVRTSSRWTAFDIFIYSILWVLALAAPSAYAGEASPKLTAGETLSDGQYIQSGNFKLKMQTDGNLVLYQYLPRLHDTFPIWASGTAGNPNAYLIMQADGNLVIYTSTCKPPIPSCHIWATMTNGHPGSYLELSDTGEFAIITTNWVSNTEGDTEGNDKMFANESICSADYQPSACGALNDRTSENGVYRLAFGEGCSLVLEQNYTEKLWDEGSASKKTCSASMLSNSNFVIEQLGEGGYLWDSGSVFDNSGAYLQVQNDGNMVIYSNWRKALWWTGTEGR